MNITENAYKEIFKVLKKHKAAIVFDVDELNIQAKHHLFGVELKEKHGFNIDSKKIINSNWHKLGDNMIIGRFGTETEHKRTISWSDDGTQPIDEVLLYISYPTGAYIFGSDYPTKFFQAFFLELKTYNPKYIDSSNHCLYFSMDNAGKIFNQYGAIIERYYAENKKDIKQRQIEKMKDDLAKLESTS